MAAPLPPPSDPPRPPVAHASWQAAKRAVLAALADGETLVALIGPPGIGKSRLLRELEQALRAPNRPVARLDDGALLDPAALPPLLLVDEAERLSDAALLGLARRGGGLAVLAALPGFGARLAGLPHRAVALAPLRPQDVPAYLAARMAEAGLDGRRLADGTAAALAEAAQGIPARLNLLAGTSFLAADIAGAATVEPAHVREAVAMQAELAAGAPAEPPAGAPTAPSAGAPAEPPAGAPTTSSAGTATAPSAGALAAPPVGAPAAPPVGAPAALIAGAATAPSAEAPARAPTAPPARAPAAPPAPPKAMLPGPVQPMPGTALAVLPPAAPRRRLPPWPLAAAALLLAGGIGWLVLGGTQPPIPAPGASAGASAGAGAGAPPAAIMPPASGDTIAAAVPPVTDMPVADGPVADGRVADRPTTDMPVTDMPVTDMPVTDMPVTDMLVTGGPVAESPVADTPAGEVPMPGAPLAEPPAPGTPAAARALPPGALPRVVVTYPRGTDTAAATALAAGLAGAGWTAGAPFPVTRAATAPELRYFFREDRAAALAVQALGLAPLGLATAQLEPLTGGLPRPGAIEAALPATPGPPAEPPPPDAPAPAPAAATLLAPAGAATLAQRSPTLSWRPAADATADFVEVVALEADGTAREVFAAYAATAGQQPLRLDGPGRYAWRVLAVSAAAQRYTPSPWRIFTLTETPP